MKKTADKLVNIAQKVASSTPGFFDTKGPGKGNRATNKFMEELRARAYEAFGIDYSEKKICGENSFAVDFYIPSEATIVEVALGLKKPNTEYEKDVLKAVMAKEMGNKVKRLLFISKPGAHAKCSQPGRLAIREWLKRRHGILIEVYDLRSVVADGDSL